MDIEGTYTLQASPEAVKYCLSDQQALLRCIPGIEGLEALNDHTWAFTLNIKQAPLSDDYRGTATLLEQQSAHHYHLVFQTEGKQNKCDGEWTIGLSRRDADTIISYSGSIQFDKHAGRLQGLSLPRKPLLKGALKLLVQQFFTALTDQLRVISAVQPVIVHEEANGAEDIASSLRLHPSMSELLTPIPQYSGSTSSKVALPQNQHRFLHFVVHRLGLGEGNPEAEQRWVNRARRFGVLSVLALLVWVGTRLPGKILDRR